ncbi:hypothetical protein ACIGEP_00280 [Microbacterium sp. NPDC077663]|uniref:hypothetical protein n=1 Tax=Microbacterium sp. NPDC077663 TaxID=3364189 RepID=UPI0037C4F0E4
MSAVEGIATEVTVRIYGASELGVLAQTAPGSAHPRVEYVGGEVFVGLDHGDHGAPVTQGETEGADAGFRDAVRSAIPLARELPVAHEGSIVLADETLAAAVLLDPSRLSGIELSGAPVAFPYARDRVLIVGADDSAAIARTLDVAEELYEADRPLVSAHPVVLTDEGWAPFPWRERLPELAMRFERVLRLFSVRAYDLQTAALQRPDVHIAPAKIRVLESGVTTTFATWPQGTATLLPVVDNVIIADPSGTLSVATLTQFLDAAGDAVIRTGLSPARYFVPGDQPRTSEA